MSSTSSVAPQRDVPVPSPADPRRWGSDAIADLIRALDIPYVVLNPGSSFRGLHDSLVNHLGNHAPQMITVLHEEHSVAIAHGYAKASGRMLAVVMHSNVGLMHGAMAVYNAWCDRVPVLMLGATGPIDAAKRRPWIDWLHTSQDQAAMIRPYIKWDGQALSVPAAQEALLRASQIARTTPAGPTYVCLDVSMQEQLLEAPVATPDVTRYQPPLPARPDPLAVRTAAELLQGARRPLILMGRVGRGEAAWHERVALAERLGARVMTDLKAGAAFPTDHPLHPVAPGIFLAPDAAAQLRQADVVLSLDWVDLAGTLKQAYGNDPVTAKVIQVSPDQVLHNGWSMDHQGLPPTDVYMMSDPDTTVPLLRKCLADLDPASVTWPAVVRPEVKTTRPEDGVITLAWLARCLEQARGELPITLVRLPLGWSGDMAHFRHPMDYLGYDGGGGIGSGPGMTVGAALALQAQGRLAVALLGDGDTLMGLTALWSAANLRLPLVVIVCNNRSFFNDELHQERVARERGRPVENRWIGQRIDDPDPDLAMLARGQGLLGLGPVTDVDALPDVLAEALAAAQRGASVVVDVRVASGYNPAMSSGMTRTYDDE